MRLLLDTHIYLWALANSAHLGTAVRDTIQNAEEVYVSAASIWEACIKIGIGRLDVSPEALVQGIEASGFSELPVLASHTVYITSLPDIHRDPFDRLLVAQAMAGPMRLLTADSRLAPYSDLVTVVE